MLCAWSDSLLQTTNNIMLGFRLPPRCKLDLPSSGILRNVEWQFRTYVAGKTYPARNERTELQLYAA